MDNFVWLVDGIFLRPMCCSINDYGYWIPVRQALLSIGFIFLLAVWQVYNQSKIYMNTKYIISIFQNLNQKQWIRHYINTTIL
jgi:Zn-dependent protease